MEINIDTRECIARIDRDIAADVTATMLEADKVRARDLAPEHEEDRLKTLRHEHRLRIEPLKRAREYIFKQLAHIEALKAPGPIFIQKL